MPLVCLFSGALLSFLAKRMCSIGQGLCQIFWQLPLPLAQEWRLGTQRGLQKVATLQPWLVRVKLCGVSEYLHSLPVEGKVQGGEKRETEKDRHTHIHQRRDRDRAERDGKKKTEIETHKEKRDKEGMDRG